MKPPVRRRSAPLRYEVSVPGVRASPCSAWSPREKLLLFKALKEQRQQKEPDIKALQDLLPLKSQAEIVAFIHMLKGRVAREAVRKEYYRCQEEKKIKESQVLAPIEVWTNLAEKVSYNLEEAITAAFSQILTIAATEPNSILYSVPRKPTKTTGRKILNSSVESRQSSSSLPVSHNIPEPTTGTCEAISVRVTGTSQSQEAVPATAVGESTSPGSEDFNVDFEKIYKYLSTVTRGGKVPELSSFEAAVLLDLLMSLPDELIQLDCVGLRTHMYRSFNQLNSLWPSQKGPREGGEQEESAGTVPSEDSPQESSSAGNPGNIAEAQFKSSKQERDCTFEEAKQNGAKTPSVTSNLFENQTCTENATVQDKEPQWKELSVCPLNSFLIPIELLSQMAKN